MPPLGVPALDLPGLVYGFETRLAAMPGTEREVGRSNVRSALEIDGEVFFMTQVHGCVIARAPWQGAPAADGALAGGAGQIVAVETADCVPLLLVDAEARLAAAVHAGWRGTAAAIAARSVAALVELGANPSRLLAVIGPSIGPCCYEVGEELRGLFGAPAERVFSRGANARPHLDLWAANEMQLVQAGLDPAHVHRSSVCTFCGSPRLPSYRRDGAGCGRIVSYVGWQRSAVEDRGAPRGGDRLSADSRSGDLSAGGAGTMLDAREE